MFDVAAETIRSSVQFENNTLVHKLITGKIIDEQRLDRSYTFSILKGDGSPSYAWSFPSYRGLIPNNLSAKKKLEHEPSYVIADIIKMLTPAAKIIFIMRDPVERSEDDSKLRKLSCFCFSCVPGCTQITFSSNQTKRRVPWALQIKSSRVSGGSTPALTNTRHVHASTTRRQMTRKGTYVQRAIRASILGQLQYNNPKLPHAAVSAFEQVLIVIIYA
jgi:hypothetical protein